MVAPPALRSLAASAPRASAATTASTASTRSRTPRCAGGVMGEEAQLRRRGGELLSPDCHRSCLQPVFVQTTLVDLIAVRRGLRHCCCWGCRSPMPAPSSTSLPRPRRSATRPTPPPRRRRSPSCCRASPSCRAPGGRTPPSSASRSLLLCSQPRSATPSRGRAPIVAERAVNRCARPKTAPPRTYSTTSRRSSSVQ